MSQFPETSATMIAKIRELPPGRDSAEWVRFWDSYALAIRRFAAMKGGEENADDILMKVVGKLVDVLRSGQYTAEKGRFHSYLAAMILNEVRMDHRRDLARAADRKVSLDAPRGEDAGAVADTISAPEVPPEELDADWRRAVLASATDFVLTRTALSARDREVYRAYALEGHDIGEVAGKFGISRNLTSQIKTRVERRIVEVGRRLVAGEA